MSTRATASSSTRLDCLKQIYGDAVAPDVARKIDALVEKYAGRVGAQNGQAPLSERDVLLITYGDTLTEPGVAPLKALRDFYARYLRGVFELLHILPFNPYSSDDGFSVIDYYAVRDDLGEWRDIEALAADCRLMVDAVINHMSSESEWFAGFLDGDPEFNEYFVEGDPGDDLSSVTRPRTSPLLTEFEDSEGKTRYVWTTFSADQVDLNFRNPAVLLAVIDVLFFLISKGARLLRLDAVTFLWKQVGTSCANLPETHALIKVMRSAVSELRDDVVVITETNVPHRENIAYFGSGSDEAQMVYNFALPPLVAHSFITADARQLSEWARRLSLPTEKVCFLNFSSSHDGVGVRPVEEILSEHEVQNLVDAALDAGGRVSSRTMSDGRERPYELNCTFLDLISRRGEDPATTVARFIASQAIVLAMPGVPAIYIQSLLGTRNDLELVRKTGRARSINRSQHAMSEVAAKLDDESGFEARIFNELTGMVRVRRECGALNPYTPFEVVDLDKGVFAVRRGETASGAYVTCVVNVCAHAAHIEVDANLSGKDLLSDARIDGGYLELAPYAVLWIAADPRQ